jgi:acyl-CoA thioesterase-1
MKTILALLILAGGAAAQTGPAFDKVEDIAGLPRVLLIGDSISIGYTAPVRELLKGKANVHRIPTNGGPTIRGMEQMDKWLAEGRWDVIHFNFGLHDLKIGEEGSRQVPLEQYGRNLREIVAKLNKTGARLIWANTTPVPDAKTNPPRQNADVIAYNMVARRIMEEKGIPIDDLYGLVQPRLAAVQLPANVHFTTDGYAVLGERVAAAIAAELRR